MGETGREVETACRTQVRVGVLVLGVDAMKGRLWWDWMKQVRGGDSSGAQGVEGGRDEGRGMGPCGFPQGEGGRGGGAAAGLSTALRS